MNSTESAPLRPLNPHHARVAFAFSIPIAMLGGLIGLGGAEFRLPVLVGPLGYQARKAVALNLVVSLITILAALLIRGRTLSFTALQPLVPTMLAMIGGAVVTAIVGTSLVKQLSNEQLEQIILVFLVVIGTALVSESFLPTAIPALVPNLLLWRVGTGVLFGLAIGFASSMLGVAGGELIIPTLIFAYGVDVKLAGTASLLISLPTVLVGVIRYARQGAFGEQRLFTETIGPMGLGSVIGALIGGTLVGLIPSAILKFGLGIILIISAVRIFRHRRGT